MNGVVPYVGAGIGFAHHMGDVRAMSTHAAGGDNRLFAWALMAGFGYQLTERAILDIGYRYIDLGSVRSGMTRCCPGSRSTTCRPTRSRSACAITWVQLRAVEIDAAQRLRAAIFADAPSLDSIHYPMRMARLLRTLP